MENLPRKKKEKEQNIKYNKYVTLTESQPGKKKPSNGKFTRKKKKKMNRI